MIGEIFTESALIAVLVAAIAGAMPLLLAAIGETAGEQSGVLNLGLEGMLLAGGFAAFVVTLATESFWLGFLAGALAGMVLAGIMVLFAVVLGASQIVVGLGITLLGAGVSSLLFDHLYSATLPRVGSAGSWTLWPLSEVPVIGEAFFSQHGMFYLAFALAVLTSLVLGRTHAGLRLRAAGRKPHTLDAVGGSALRTRALAVMFSGGMAGLGGAYLVLIAAGTFTPGMTHGLGFLAIVTAMISQGRIGWVIVVSFAYGAIVATGLLFQVTGGEVSTDLITILPFVAVLIALAAFSRRGSALPPALAAPYARIR